jgi:hypothetical protein
MSPFAASLVAPRLYSWPATSAGAGCVALGQRRGHFSVTLGKRFSKNRRFIAAWLVRVFRDIRPVVVSMEGASRIESVNRFLQYA